MTGAASLLLAAAALVLPGCEVGGRDRPANVVLVVVDTLRQDRVGAYGYRGTATPTFDALARDGCLAQGIAPTSWTRPSVVTLLSGVHPIRHQVADKTDATPATIP